MIGVDETLRTCDALDIRLSVSSDGLLEIDAPKEAWNPELFDAIKCNKQSILAKLRKQYTIQTSCTRCGSTKWREISIHEGQSVRRDCAKCGRFLEFSVWYGKLASSRAEPEVVSHPAQDRSGTGPDCK